MLEICCSSIEDAISAQTAGADRIELCVGLSVGGLTPSGPLVQGVCEAVALPVRPLIRPRDGHFVFSRVERQLIADEAKMAMEAGAAGVVIGGLTSDGELDQALLDSVLASVDPGLVTFHRAIDEARHILSGYATLCDYGIGCVLTSGAAHTAIEGIEVIRQLAACKGSTTIMAGSGVKPDNATDLLQAGVGWLHFSARHRSKSPYPHRLFDESVARVDERLVAEMRRVMTEFGS